MWKKFILALALAAPLTVPTASVVRSERAGAPLASEARDKAKGFVAGDGFTCLLGGDGTIRCWGANGLGQIGNGDLSINPVLTPTLVAGISTAVEITAGGSHACALLADGTAKCWGRGVDGQLGNGSFSSSATPVAVKDPAGTGLLSGIRTLSAGVEHTCAVRESDGAVFCWGDEIDGHLGNGSTSTLQPLPIQVKVDVSTNLIGIRDLAVGGGTSCGLNSDGVAYCWGSDYYSQLGNNAPGTSSTYAIAWGSVSGLIGLDVGGNHVCGYTTGAMYCAGGVTVGGYEFGQMLQKATPYAIPVSSVKQVALSNAATCYIDSTSHLLCAGGLSAGVTRNVWADGTGATGYFATSVSLSNVRALAAGANHFCAYLDSGIKCWGSNASGELGGGGVSTYQSATSVLAAVAGSISIGDPGSIDVSTSSLTASATTNSGGVVTWSVDSASSSVCSIGSTSGVISVLGAGDCILRVEVAESGLFTTATATRTISISATSPTLATPESSDVDYTSATVTSLLNPRGASSTTSVRVGTKALLETFDSTPVAGTTSGVSQVTKSAALTNLRPGTTYYFQFVGVNAVGTTLSSISSFTTLGSAPRVTTGTSKAATASADVSGEVTAGGLSTTASFEYGTDSTLSVKKSVGVAAAVTGSTATAVAATLDGLVPGTKYYFRLVASNAVDTISGDIKFFSTKGGKPVAATGSVTPSATKATMNGKVNPSELDTTITFEYGTDAKLATSTSTPAQTKSGADDVDLSATITGLDEKTTYYYRIVATNVVGTAKGDIKSFVTTKPEGVSINDGDEFTGSQQVTISIVGPSNAAKAILSNDGGFKTSETVALTNGVADVPWTLQSSREGTFTKIVYIRLISRFESTLRDLSDDIILDTTKPAMSTTTAAAATPANDAVQVAAVRAAAKSGIKLSVRGSDTISGIGSVEVRSSAAKPTSVFKLKAVAGKADGKARSMNQTISLKSTAKRLQVRVVDRAGNASAWRSIIVK